MPVDGVVVDGDRMADVTDVENDVGEIGRVQRHPAKVGPTDQQQNAACAWQQNITSHYVTLVLILFQLQQLFCVFLRHNIFTYLLPKADDFVHRMHKTAE